MSHPTTCSGREAQTKTNQYRMNKLVRLLMVAFVTIFTLDTAVATAPTTKTPANITSPVLVRSYYREEGTNGRDRCVSLWPRQYSPSAASPWLVNIKYWPTAETYSVMPGIWVPTLKFFWATDNAGHIKFRHESSPFWSDPIPLNPYGLNSQNAYAIEVTDSGTTVFVNGVGTRSHSAPSNYGGFVWMGHLQWADRFDSRVVEAFDSV